MSKRRIITGLYWVAWPIFVIIASTPPAEWAVSLMKSHTLIYFAVGILVILLIGWLFVWAAGVPKHRCEPVSLGDKIEMASAVCIWAWFWPFFVIMAALAYGLFKIETRKGDWI